MEFHEPLYPDKRIRKRSITHVSDERLLARLEHARLLVYTSREWAEQKSDFKNLVAEITRIEDELTRRNITFVFVTKRE